MEEVRILPYVGARRTDADRNIAFEDDAPLPCVTAGVAQLAVQMILQETVEIDRCPIPVPEYAETLFVVTGILAPLPEIGRTEAVAQGAERGVGFQPQTVLRLEGGIAVRRPDGLPRPAEKQPCPVEFQPHDRLVIDGGQGVEPSLLATVAGIGLQPRPDQAQVERMEGETRNGVVGIGVASRSRADRIVDRQQLYDPLPRGCGPVDQFPQVGEFARTETRRRTQRKERQGRTCAMRRRSPRAAAVRPRRCALPPPAAGRSVGSPPPPTRSVDGNGDRAARTCIRTELQHRARPARAGNRGRPVRRIAASRPVRARCRRWPTLRRGARSALLLAVPAAPAPRRTVSRPPVERRSPA